MRNANAIEKKLGPNDTCWCGSGRKYKKCHQGSADDRQPESASLPADNALSRIGNMLKRSRTKFDVPNPIMPGVVSPTRAVPDSIARPDYALTGQPRAREPRNLAKNSEQIARMRRSGALARKVLEKVLASVRAGITTDELDAIGHEEAIRHGAYPSPLNYRGFPKSICTSVNEVICHGIPDSRALQDGDIVNCDVTVYFDGMHGDCSETVMIGDVDDASRQLVAATRESLEAAISIVRPGARLRDIGRAIEDVVVPRGYSVVRDFAGHGIGEVFHMRPSVVHYYDRNATLEFVPGMTFTIEPMINQGVADCVVWDDEWTAVTADLGRSAQFEHTVLVTAGGVELLTAPR